MKFDNTLLKAVQYDIRSGNIPMLLGEPGIGKSSWIESLAEINRTKCFVLPCNQLADKADLTGARMVPVYTPVKDENGQPTGENEISGYEQVFYPHAVIRRAIQYALDNPREEPILFMDELNRTTPDVTSECLSIPTARTIGNTTLPKNLKVITAGNDKGNITALDEASISRFVLYHVDPDIATFLMVNPELNPFVKKTLEHNPDTLLCKTINISSKTDDGDTGEVDINEILNEGEEMNQITTPRTLTSVSNWLNQFTNDELLGMLTDIRHVNGEDISVLEESLIAHTGATNFTKILISEIANNVNNVVNQSSMLITEPRFWNEIKSLKTLTDITAYVENLTDDDKAIALLYGLYEKQDNKALIQTIAKNLKKMSVKDLKTLFTLYDSLDIDEQNMNAFMEMNTELTEKVRPLIGFN